MGQVYTRTGDKGTTHLGDGELVPKDSRRVATSGMIDEAGTFFGFARAVAPAIMKGKIAEVQSELIMLMARISRARPDAPLPDASVIEERIEEIRKVVPMPDKFVIPGDSKAGASLHMARTIVRRAEREAVALDREESLDPAALKYINRLSDLAFAMALWADHEEQVQRIVADVIEGEGKEECTMLLNDAKKILAVMEAKATNGGVPMAMAICDADGTLVAFMRQENVLPVSIDLARRKAFTAIQLKCQTSDLAAATQPGAPLYGLQSDPALVVFGGGIPLVKNGTIIGAVGVSGGTVEQDMAVAEAGVAAFKATDF